MPENNQETFSTIAVLDLGSNSFHMLIAAIDREWGIRILDKRGEKVQLAAGLDEARQLNKDTIQRGLDCLRGFAQMIQGMPQGSVRIVGTNALREARNRDDFIRPAEALLGHPVEVISGREEARLIYLGVARATPGNDQRRLVVDIGGGSTEFIIGQGFQPLIRESLQMGCVGYTQRFFRDGKITPARYAQAYTAARLELMAIEEDFHRCGWEKTIGASGTIRAASQALSAAGQSSGEITPDGLIWLKTRILKQNDTHRLEIAGVKPDRRNIFPAGLAILEALFDALKLSRMTHSEGALREGVMYDLIGRHQHDDIREHTITTLMNRYGVDKAQSDRVEAKALKALGEVADIWQLSDEWHRELLCWAARVHELGLAISHDQYHKHGAYILANSDLEGFSRLDQQMLALLVRGHRRNIPLDKFNELDEEGDKLLRLCILLRFAILFHHIRGTQEMPSVRLKAGPKRLTILFPDGWLDANPLTKANFEQEADWIKRVSYTLNVN